MPIKAEDKNDLEIISNNLRVYLIGNSEMNNSDWAKSKIANINKAGLNNIPDLDQNSNYVYEGVQLDNTDGSDFLPAKLSANLETTYKNFYALALALTTESDGNSLYNNKDARDKLIESMAWVHDKYLKDTDNGYYGNWYSWEIGVPMNLSKILFLLEDHFEDAFIKESIIMMDAYIRGDEELGSDLIGDINLDARQHTGANLTDITFNRIIQGLLLGDEDRIDKAVSDSMTVFKTIDPNNLEHGVTDGFYEDGSFIQHSSVAYTGSYGKVLLTRIAQLVMALDNTRWQDDTLMETVQEWVYRGFAPIMYEGYMMEIVKGRAASRTASGYADAAGVIEPLLQLALGMVEEDQFTLQSYVKYLANIPQIKSRKTDGSFVSISNIASFNSLMKDDSVPAKNPIVQNDHYAFNLMDKTVHLRDQFGFSIGKSSSRVSKYEYMSGENLESWFQGDGAFYLYQSGVDQNQSYGIDFFSTVDRYKLPGTTTVNEVRQTLPQAFGKDFFDDAENGFTSGSISQNKYVYFPLGTNDFSGGAKLGTYGVSSMQLGDEQSYADRDKLPENFLIYKNAEANKSWFMFDEEIVVLGSNIHDINGRQMTSTIDNKMFEVNETVGLISNNGILSEGDYENLEWLSVELDNSSKDVSYVFHDNKKIKINLNDRTGKYSDVRNKTTGSADKEITKKYVTMTYEHDGSAIDSYAYSIVPNKDSKSLATYLENDNIEIMKNTSGVHAVTHKALGINSYVFFGGSQEVNGVSTENEMILMQNDLVLSVQDPLHTQENVTFTIDGSYDISEGDAVATYINGKTSIIVNTKNKNGVSQEVILKEKQVVENEKEVIVDQVSGLEFAFDKGVFPAGTTVTVNKLTNKAPEGYMALLNYDITFTHEGAKVQPNGYVTVKLTYNNSASDDLYIFHFDAKYTLINSSYENGQVVFDTNSFSEYMLTKKHDSTGPVDPTDPVDPEDPTDPVDPSKPVVPVDPEDQNDPTKPTKPEGEQVLPSTGLATKSTLVMGSLAVMLGYALVLIKKKD